MMILGSIGCTKHSCIDLILESIIQEEVNTVGDELVMRGMGLMFMLMGILPTIATVVFYIMGAIEEGRE